MGSHRVNPRCWLTRRMGFCSATRYAAVLCAQSGRSDVGGTIASELPLAVARDERSGAVQARVATPLLCICAEDTSSAMLSLTVLYRPPLRSDPLVSSSRTTLHYLLSLNSPDCHSSRVTEQEVLVLRDELNRLAAQRYVPNLSLS